MKQYTKTIDGKTVIKPQNRIVVYKDGMQYINPMHDILLEDGWVEYVTPEPTEDELLLIEKRKMKSEILKYDSSNEVNIFYVNDVPVWLDKLTRAGLMLRFETEIKFGDTNTSLWYDGMKFELPLTVAQEMLYAIEKYASKCYDNTQMHIAAVDKLTSIEEVRQYDYHTGYPDKLRF